MAMRTIGIRELKRRLSEYLQYVRQGENVVVTDRGTAVAELRPLGGDSDPGRHAALARYARAGKAQLGGPNSPDLYPQMPFRLTTGSSRALSGVLLDDERGDH